MWAVLAVMLPGPWTPVIVLAYILGRANERDQDAAHHHTARTYTPDPYISAPAPLPRNPYAPTR